MAAILTSVILLAYLTQTSVGANSSALTALPEVSTEALFALQIRQIKTSSDPEPTAVPGNNLNDIGSTNPDKDVPEENSQAISTIYSIKDKKRNGDERGNVELLPFDGKDEKNNDGNATKSLAEDVIEEALPLVWDSCLETTYRDNQKNVVKASNDMEIANSDFQAESEENVEFSGFFNKRDTEGTNFTVSMKPWLAKLNSLKSVRSEERRQLKESIFIKKISDEPTTTTTTEPIASTMSTVRIIPITREIFKDLEGSLNATQKPVVTEISIKASYTEDWFEAKDRGKIRFSGLPQRETYLIPALKLEEGFHPFSFMSEFFTVIYPFDFPVGLIKDIVWGKFTFPYSFIQSIKVESTFLAFIIAFACIALVIPSYLFILGILSLFSRSRCDDETETGALFPDAEDSDCNDRVLVVMTLFVVLLCCVLISGMAVSNEQAHSAAVESSNVLQCACADVSSWLVAAARELHHSLAPPVDLLLHAFREDLKNAEVLLGEPIQQAISSESGIELVFDSLADIISESEDISSKISSLRDVSMKAGALTAAASDRINDLARQLDNLKKFCNLKDMPLCDTVNTNSLEMQMKFELILREKQLLDLRTLGVHNLTQAISTARQEFKTLPAAIATQTVQARKDILNDIETRRQSVHESSNVLNDIVRHLTAGLHSVSRRIESGLERVQKYDFWRWALMLACVVIFAFIMLLVIFAMMCGCGHAKDHGKRTLQVSAVWLCFSSLILWGMISAIFLITGHAEVYVCHPLWDKPQYETLTALLDRPSPLLHKDEGIFDALFRDLDNVTIDVSVKDFLRDCEKDRPAYIVFQLDKVLDVNKETSYFEWEELQADLGRLASSIDVGLLKTISLNFNRLLTRMLVVSDVNLAKYRMDYNGPIVGRDLPSLVDQLQNVAAQVSDLTTAGRLETMATRTRRVYMTSIKPLEQVRADVVYKLTELELQLMPFRRKLNISLSHIYTAQYYIDNQGDVIAQKKVSMYVSRLISHAAAWRTHVLMSVGKHAARCKPLFAVYSALRTLLCSKYISSLHGWWFCGVLLGLLWCSALTPLCVRLWRTYGWKIRAHETMTLTNLGSGHQESTPTTAMCDGSNWNTPGPPPAPRSDSW
ncbi:prominin-1-A [Ostrinia furnacalis]|uniref:prominin-1-A n=1 Tax=Ostrinia furnacalis TaxID=93504 RepID=UPI00103FF116|nr:prominin-1-A [Ostrinia furnacalis]